ncbi:hypothetical protein BaRGS_00004242, partial [Batillaria attramentaria]
KLCIAELVWVRDRTMDGYIMPEPGDLDSLELLTLSKGKCALKCRSYEWCSSFFYNDLTGSCSLRTLVVKTVSGAVPVTEFVYYRAATEWCDVRMGFIYYPQANFCFRIDKGPSTSWIDARSRCQDNGMDLVSADTPEKLELLMRTIKETPEYRLMMYTGGIRPFGEWDTPWPDGKPHFIWVNDKPIDASTLPWGPGQPNNLNNVQNCIQIDKNRGLLLNDLDCTDSIAFICEKLE